ncbi:hypothetical protein CANCADRAFT_121610 [Tortispora caseinolytica NRRL Y-17796]|uniref:Uncharacterized protein n=1 Tax=Tortispora caseinolytica NRRL Y-17796 TaxID=767744 RepID=A0A1E4THK1_9ASCO|nr:hypothetical protein CANCADRAFT_121610 [Tortispora caseinolytica NRRL Y-17796]
MPVSTSKIPSPSQIPPFYCCYLLQSDKKTKSFYIGSTPDPYRRLRQHNGDLKSGGAKKTHKDTSRPWNMICLVSGFPSKVSALQFERAWQHPVNSKHIARDHTNLLSLKATGPRSKTARISSLDKHLAVLRALCVHTSHYRLKLNVTFIDQTAAEVWHKNKFKLPSIPLHHSLIDAFSVEPVQEEYRQAHGTTLDALKKLRANDNQHQHIYDITDERLAACANPICGICAEKINFPVQEALVCYNNCGSIWHNKCIANQLLGERSSNIIPTRGQCPSCTGILIWSDMARDLSRRIGEHIIESESDHSDF